MNNDVEFETIKKILSESVVDDLKEKLYNAQNSDEKKYVIADFFEEYGVDVDGVVKCNKIGNVGTIIKFDKGKIDAGRKNDFVWGTLSSKDFESDIWCVCYDIERGVYLFKLPQEEGFTSDNFWVSYKTKQNNKGQDYNWKGGYWYKTSTPKYQLADFIIDVKDDCFYETGKGYYDFKRFFRAKLDFKKKELTVVTEKKLTEEEYAARRKEWLDGLNPEQRQAAETDRKGALVIAGAGCGKTRTLMGRICYLYEQKKINSPDDLLLVVFNRKNRLEFKEKLRKLGLRDYAKVSAHTFHSLGSKIITADGSDCKSFEVEESPLDVLLESFEDFNYWNNQYQGYFRDRLKKYREKIENIKNKYDWIDDLWKWSREDSKVGDYIPSRYDMLVKNTKYCSYILWLDEKNACLDNVNYRYDDEDNRKLRMLNYLLLSGYTNEDIHVDHKDKFIQIKSLDNERFYWKEYNFVENFNEIRDIIAPKRCLSDDEIFEKIKISLVRLRMYEFRKIAALFISFCKIYQKYDFERLKEDIIKKVCGSDDHKIEHVSAFFRLIKPLYDLYEEFLEQDRDYNDVINDARSKLKLSRYDNKFKYKYILVDEFQDVAYDNFELIKALKDRSDASVMCVGDDWQSIYSWRGSDPIFFKEFMNKFGLNENDYEDFRVTTTYRYGQKLADVSNEFINKCENQKDIKSDKSTPDTELIEWKKGWNELISEIEEKFGKDISVKILQRRRRDAKICSDKDTDVLVTELKQRFRGKDTTDVLTIHKAKGLEADVIVILSMAPGIFPTSCEPDPVLEYFQTSGTYEEERRLFYVAMTRAKKACYFYNPEGPFGIEIADIIKMFANQNKMSVTKM